MLDRSFRFIFALLLFICSTIPVQASPLPEPELERRQGGSLPITGVVGNGVQTRLEIRQMHSTRPNQWNIYLLALQQFQATPQTELTSWYQISSIHGAPAVPWNGVDRTSTGVGYCTHSSNLFPVWHRPYIALFEQKLVEAAILVASQFPAGPARDVYMSAASTLRAPFWDWAADPPDGLPAFPDVLTAPTVSVETPQGQKTIVNPLFRYGFHPLSNADFSPYTVPFSQWPFTLRSPESTAPTASSREGYTVQTMDKNRPAQKQSLYNWFTLCPEYNQMSNDLAHFASKSCHGNLEAMHNNIHVWVGGPNDGHMTVVPVSAYDPAFMLHHVMVDRLVAMWQTVYPDSYTSDLPSLVNTFTIKKGSTQGPNSPLTPFHRTASGDFWTANEVRDWKVFHYTYPEFADSDGSASAIRGYINRLYGPNGHAPAGSSKVKRDTDLAERGTSDLTKRDQGSKQYIANIATTRFKLGGSYTIYVFMGQPGTENAADWINDDNFVGSYGVFSEPGMEDSNIITTSTVPLTEALNNLVGGGVLGDLLEDCVEPFLADMLQWRVALMKNLEVIPPSKVPDFTLSVVSSTQSCLSSLDSFPEWSAFNLLPLATHGKEGGLQLNQTLSYLAADTEGFLTGAANLLG